MRFFWPVYLSVAAAATVGVYVAAPMARPYVPDFLKPAANFKPNALPSIRPPAAVLKIVRSAAAPRRALRNLSGTESPVPEQPAQEQPAPEQPAQELHVPEKEAAQETPAAIVAGAEEEMSPALNNIFLAGKNETPGWGVTHQRASVYKLDGSRAGHVAAGTLVRFRDFKKSSKGSMVECVVILEGRRSDPVLVSSKELRLFTGSFEKLSARQMDDLKKYYVLSGKVAERRNELLKIAAVKNPHFAQYEAAHKKLMSHIERANGLAAQRDAATGLARMRLEDQLRVMKNEEGRLRSEYNAVHKQFREWKERNADAVVKPENDPQIMRFRGEMAALRASLPGLTY